MSVLLCAYCNTSIAFRALSPPLWLLLSLISKEFLVRLKNTFAFAMSVNRQYNNLFQGKGTKPGTTVDLRRPVYLSGGRGQEITPEGIKDNLVPLTINTQYHQAVAISAQEEALNMESYSQQVVQPAVDVIANMIDVDGLKLVDEVPRFVGVPGTNPASNQVYIDAGVQLDNEAVPGNDIVRHAMLNPKQSGGILGTQATQFNPSKDVSEQNRTGNMGMAWGFNFGKDQNVNMHVAGGFGVQSNNNQPLVDGEVTEGATKVHIDRLANKNAWGRKGDKFQIVGCGAVNPLDRSKNPTGEDKFFTLTADVDSAGNEADLPCYPAIRATGPNATVSELPADNAVVVFWGQRHSGTTHPSSNLTFPMGVCYHKDFITFATVDLFLPPNQVMSSRAFSEDFNHVRIGWKSEYSDTRPQGSTCQPDSLDPPGRYGVPRVRG